MEKCVGERSEVTTDKDRPSSWRDGGGNDGGGGAAGVTAGESGRVAFSLDGLAGPWSSAIVSRAGEARGASRRWIKLLKKPESLFDDRTCETRYRIRIASISCCDPWQETTTHFNRRSMPCPPLLLRKGAARGLRGSRVLGEARCRAGRRVWCGHMGGGSRRSSNSRWGRFTDDRSIPLPARSCIPWPPSTPLTTAPMTAMPPSTPLASRSRPTSSQSQLRAWTLQLSRA